MLTIKRSFSLLVLGGLLATLGFYGCVGKTGGSSLTLTQLSTLTGASQASLTKGRAFFLRECASCHRHYWPPERSPQEWQTILPRHRKRVSLTGEQFDKLEKYLTLASEHSTKMAPEDAQVTR